MNLDNFSAIGGGSVTAMILTVQTISVTNSLTVAFYGAVGGLAGWIAKEVFKWFVCKCKSKLFKSCENQSDKDFINERINK
jgi:hypothetical protein